VEAVTVGQPPRRPQGAYVASLTALPEPVAFEAPGPDPTWPGVDVQEGRELVARLSDRTHRQQPQDPEQAAEEQPDRLPQQLRPFDVGQQGEEGGPPHQVVRVASGQRGGAGAAGGCLGVEDDRLGDDVRLVPGPRGAPAEVDVV